ncbi:MAG: ABC transporter substrate-binding protein [Paludibacteraceae bacterium]|nr:ABC transporter substrate-binding protein [Paludibacteraceae bacterium]
MKKLSLLAVGLMMAAATCFGADRANTLKIYNWADYIDFQVLEEFKQWYTEQTGQPIEIIYQTFDINETMLTEIEVGHEDYDVICPSEYIIERMLRKGLLQPIRKDVMDEHIRYFHNVAPFVEDKFQQMAPADSVLVSDYTVGYMWGTTGWLYNPALVSADKVQSWGALVNEEFKNHIFVKDAFRDVYSVLVLYAYREEIAKGEVTRDELVRDITPERMERVEEILMAAKDNIAGWEVDFGKEEMTKGKMWLNLSWSGDAQWAIDEAAENGVELEYVVPQEGSNVWFDGWCIPIYAKNPIAASYFIDYMCRPDNAIRNMEEIGYVSVIASPEILEWANDEEIEETSDLSYFFGEKATAVHANHVMYPDLSVIERCALMHDCADQTEDMLKMWTRVKGDNLGSSMIIIVVVTILAIMFGVILQTLNRRKQRAMQRKPNRR